jgi:tetratricopeptide (TPR) repeat protein
VRCSHRTLSASTGPILAVTPSGASTLSTLTAVPPTARAFTWLADVWQLTSDYPAAAQAQEVALGIYRDLCERHGQANGLHQLGIVRRVMGDYGAAAQALDEALGIFRDVGIRSNEVESLNERGVLYWVSGELALAEGCPQQSLELAARLTTHTARRTRWPA